MGGVPDFGEPDFAVERFFGDAFRLFPHIGLVDTAEVFALAGKGELAGQMPMRVLINDPADIMRVIA
jgi:hypothetical protein